MKLEIDKFKYFNKNIQHLNIILVGPSGVGKSTLINAILELKEDKIECGFGRPMKRDIKFYESEKYPFLRLADSQGMEKNEEFGVEKICQQIKSFINSQWKSKDYDKYIHCIWYCWTGARLEDSEIQVLKQLSEQYTLDNLPVIIVYTKAINAGEIEKAKKWIKEELNLSNEFIEVVAEPIIININKDEIKSFNLDKLIDESIKYAKQSIKSSSFQGLIGEIQENITIKLKEIIDQIKKKIESDKQIILQNLEINNINDFKENTYSLLLKVLYKYFLLDPDASIKGSPEMKFKEIEFSFTQSSHLLLNNFIENYFSMCLANYKENIFKIVEENEKNILYEIIKFKNQFIEDNQYFLKDINLDFNDIQFQKKLKNDLYEIIGKIGLIAAYKNSFMYFTDPLIEQFGEYFLELYNQGMKKDTIIKYASNAVKINFKEIEVKIEEYKKEKKIENIPSPSPLQTSNEVNKLFSESDIN